MCNYKESCEKPLLERMGNWDIFIAGLSSTVETDRSYSRGSIAVSARRSIAPPKSLWPNARTLKFPIVLSLQTYNLRHDPVLCCGWDEHCRHFARQKVFTCFSGLWFLHAMILHLRMTLKKYKRFFFQYFLVWLMILCILCPALLSAWWNLIKLPNFYDRIGGEASCIFIPAFTGLHLFENEIFLGVLTLWSLHD